MNDLGEVIAIFLILLILSAVYWVHRADIVKYKQNHYWRQELITTGYAEYDKTNGAWKWK